MFSIATSLLLTAVTARTLEFSKQTANFSEFGGPGGLYQSSYSNGKLYVTNTIGRPPINDSNLLEVDPESLKVVKNTVPEVANSTLGRWAVYGVSVDNKNGLVWVTNTREGTVSTYKQGDLSLVSHFKQGLQGKPRDVLVDQSTGLAYVSASRSDVLDVFSANKTDGFFKRVNLTEKLGHTFKGVMSLVGDEKAGKLYTVSLTGQEAAEIDFKTLDVKSYSLGKNVNGSSGVAWDAGRKHLFVANQYTNNTVVLDTTSGKVVKEIDLPGGPLNALYDPKFDVVYVACRTGHKVSVIDASDYSIITELNVTTPNHISRGNNGEIFVTDKSKEGLLYKFTPTNSSSNGGSASNSSASGGPGGKGGSSASGSAGKGGAGGKGGSSAPSNGAGALAVPMGLAAGAMLLL